MACNLVQEIAAAQGEQPENKKGATDFSMAPQ
jgi:hypothetical protein